MVTKKINMIHRYSWHPDLPDFRDFKYALHRLKVSPIPVVLPIKIDLRSFCSPVFDQGQYGSCTSQSLAGHLEFLELKEIREKTVAPEEFDPNAFTLFSRLFIYYNERLIENTVNQDSGAQIRDGIKSLAQWGDCKEGNWSYMPGNVFAKPSDVAYQEASNHKISTYMRLESLEDIKNCLNEGYPVSFGFTVFESFEGPTVANTGIVPVPSLNEDIEGGHAVLAVGYDDEHNWLIVRNSWGPIWGDRGYFYLPYEFINDRNLSDDYWTIRR
jgi:C1A family cysteine protease